MAAEELMPDEDVRLLLREGVLPWITLQYAAKCLELFCCSESVYEESARTTSKSLLVPKLSVPLMCCPASPQR